MLRTLSPLALIFALFCLSAFRLGDPFSDANPLIYNTTLAQMFHSETRSIPAFEKDFGSIEVDTATRSRILMLTRRRYAESSADICPKPFLQTLRKVLPRICQG
jgi:hypothetical protein